MQLRLNLHHLALGFFFHCTIFFPSGQGNSKIHPLRVSITLVHYQTGVKTPINKHANGNHSDRPSHK